MDLYCVMGNPVEHSRSPWIHARFAELTGQALAYERQLAPLDGFAATVRDFRAGGRARLQRHRAVQARGRALASWQSSEACAGGRGQHPAASTATDIRADNTDGLGLVADITRNAPAWRWPGATCCSSAPAARPPACWARCSASARAAS
jgi:shikimate dehydrogenase